MSTQSKKQPKIYFMGKEMPHEELPETPELDIEQHFKPVILSQKAIDLASQLVPDEHWKKYGLYSWLSGRADVAFRKLPISAEKLEVRIGRLLYKFEFTPEGPTLKSVVLV